MGSPKTLTKYGLLAALETVYGTPPVLDPATDGVDLIAMPVINTDYAHQGERAGKSPASHGARKRVGRMGRFGTGTVQLEPCGAGVAYAADVLPNVHTWLLAGGFSAAVDTTPGSEKVTYTPHAVGDEESISCEAYVRGEKKVLSGVYANTKLTSSVPGIPLFEFALSGIQPALPIDALVPEIVYPTVEPPKAEAVQLTIGSWVVGNIQSLEFNYERNLNARLLNNATGLHGGWNVGVARTITLTAIVEAVALKAASPWSGAGTYNPFASMEEGEEQAISFTIGATQYERMKFQANQAQLIAAPEQEEGAASLWSLQWECKPSTLVANDECAFIFD